MLAAESAITQANCTYILNDSLFSFYCHFKLLFIVRNGSAALIDNWPLPGIERPLIAYGDEAEEETVTWPHIMQTSVERSHRAGFGRLGEVANGCFVALQFAESGFYRLASLEKRDRREWVDF
jgi:hypothetical protein